MQRKEYKLPNGKTAVFEYDACEIGKITLECMDELMSMIADRPQGEWIEDYNGGGFKEWLDITCSLCGETLHDIQKNPRDYEYCPFCGARMKGAEDGNK